MSDVHDNQRAAFDDDRLLDFALGLEDDPELAAALSHSARLRERLADLKSDLATIDSELRRCVPPADDTWCEPSATRWPRLRRSFGLGVATGSAGRSGRRVATALVAAALLLAVAIGAVVVLPRGGGSSNSAGTAAGPEQSAAAPAAQAGGLAGSAASPAVVATKAADYGVVAVVRVGPLRGASQSYTTVRRLKGHAPAVFTLTLQAIDNAPQAGALALAYLDPIAGSGGTTHATAATPGPGSMFTLDGRPAFVTALPTGATAGSVRLPG